MKYDNQDLSFSGFGSLSASFPALGVLCLYSGENTHISIRISEKERLILQHEVRECLSEWGETPE